MKEIEVLRQSMKELSNMENKTVYFLLYENQIKKQERVSMMIRQLYSQKTLLVFLISYDPEMLCELIQQEKQKIEIKHDLSIILLKKQQKEIQNILYIENNEKQSQISEISQQISNFTFGQKTPTINNKKKQFTFGVESVLERNQSDLAQIEQEIEQHNIQSLKLEKKESEQYKNNKSEIIKKDKNSDVDIDQFNKSKSNSNVNVSDNSNNQLFHLSNFNVQQDLSDISNNQQQMNEQVQHGSSRKGQLNGNLNKSDIVLNQKQQTLTYIGSKPPKVNNINLTQENIRDKYVDQYSCGMSSSILDNMQVKEYILENYQKFQDIHIQNSLQKSYWIQNFMMAQAENGCLFIPEGQFGKQFNEWGRNQRNFQEISESEIKSIIEECQMKKIISITVR